MAISAVPCSRSHWRDERILPTAITEKVVTGGSTCRPGGARLDLRRWATASWGDRSTVPREGEKKAGGAGASLRIKGRADRASQMFKPLVCRHPWRLPRPAAATTRRVELYLQPRSARQVA